MVGAGFRVRVSARVRVRVWVRLRISLRLRLRVSPTPNPGQVVSGLKDALEAEAAVGHSNPSPNLNPNPSPSPNPNPNQSPTPTPTPGGRGCARAPARAVAAVAVQRGPLRAVGRGGRAPVLRVLTPLVPRPPRSVGACSRFTCGLATLGPAGYSRAHACATCVGGSRGVYSILSISL